MTPPHTELDVPGFGGGYVNARLVKELTAYGKTWPVGSTLHGLHFDVKFRYCALLPDGHSLTHIQPDSFVVDENAK